MQTGRTIWAKNIRGRQWQLTIGTGLGGRLRWGNFFFRGPVARPHDQIDQEADQVADENEQRPQNATHAAALGIPINPDDHEDPNHEEYEGNDRIGSDIEKTIRAELDVPDPREFHYLPEMRKNAERCKNKRKKPAQNQYNQYHQDDDGYRSSCCASHDIPPCL
jgi:hypothetical protein